MGSARGPFARRLADLLSDPPLQLSPRVPRLVVAMAVGTRVVSDRHGLPLRDRSKRTTANGSEAGGYRWGWPWCRGRCMPRAGTTVRRQQTLSPPVFRVCRHWPVDTGPGAGDHAAGAFVGPDPPVSHTVALGFPSPVRGQLPWVTPAVSTAGANLRGRQRDRRDGSEEPEEIAGVGPVGLPVTLPVAEGPWGRAGGKDPSDPAFLVVRGRRFLTVGWPGEVGSGRRRDQRM